jgi:glyoxylase-like metal-dependent hydrolase (beta-lactamase superfamily II)
MTGTAGGPPLDLDVRWVHGARDGDPPGPPVQVHAVDDRTYVLRQNKSVHWEGPFLHLLLGEDRALLLDTGATEDPAAFPLRAAVDAVLDGLPLVVAHTHGHGDHVAADGQFADRPDTVVVGRDPAAVRSFFGFTDWPDEVVTFDLGGRVLELTGIPGHHETSIAVFDPRTGFLLTGDTVYPGRLYVFDHAAFVASLERLVAFASVRPVTHVLGCHIELQADGGEYPTGTRYQPDEPPIQMAVGVLERVREVAVRSRGRSGRHPGPGFVVVNMNGLGPLKLVAHSLRPRLRS